MHGKNIKIHLRKKIEDWADSVDDIAVRNAIFNDTIISGGAIVSLLTDEEPNDYDVYFRNERSLKLVAQYYVDKYVSTRKEEVHVAPIVQRCVWEDGRVDEYSHWRVVSNDYNSTTNEEIRIRLFIKSVGAVGEGFDNYAADGTDYQNALQKLNSAHKKKKEKDEEAAHYQPRFFTNNAISLSDKIQIVVRFYGEPERILSNFDFVHCTSYYDMGKNKLVMPSRALEAIINKELFYVGSKYPLCSIIRSRKYIMRGWTINAGQYVKMVLQLNELNLKNLHVFEEQLVGVDSAYFTQFLNAVRQAQSSDSSFEMTPTYLGELIDNVFGNGETELTNE